MHVRQPSPSTPPHTHTHQVFPFCGLGVFDYLHPAAAPRGLAATIQVAGQVAKVRSLYFKAAHSENTAARTQHAQHKRSVRMHVCTVAAAAARPSRA